MFCEFESAEENKHLIGVHGFAEIVGDAKAIPVRIKSDAAISSRFEHFRLKRLLEADVRGVRFVVRERRVGR